VINRYISKYIDFMRRFAEALPDEFRGKSLTVLAKETVFVSSGGRDIIGLNLGDKLVLMIGNEPSINKETKTNLKTNSLT